MRELKAASGSGTAFHLAIKASLNQATYLLKIDGG